MTKDKVVALIREVGILPAVRVSSVEDAHFSAETVTHAGIPIVEITMTVPGALDVIANLVRSESATVVGAGGVLDVETARRCLDAGAGFITSPSIKPAVVEFVAKHDVAVFPGALTPTEVVDAWDAGANLVKVFPCEPVGGDKYINSLTIALPKVGLIAAGGVKQQTAGQFILAGAAAVGVGRELIPSEAIAKRQAARIRELCLRFLKTVKDAREQFEAWRQTQLVKGSSGSPKRAL